MHHSLILLYKPLFGPRRGLTQITVKHQITLFEPIYARRQAVLTSIPSFWSIIFENFGPELDEHITPEDWAFLGENLTAVNVSRPDVANNNPRTFEITFGLKEGNGVIDGTEIKKKFMYKSLRDRDESWTGLVSEPLEVKWVSEEKDLTGGINGLSKRIFEVRRKRVERRIEEKKNGGKGKGKQGPGKVTEDDGLSELELDLDERLNQAQSFFNWLSWTGDFFMVMEKEAEIKLREEKKAKGEEVAENEYEESEDDEPDGIDVFPGGEKLAYLFAEDMFPNALKHFGELPYQQRLHADTNTLYFTADAMEHNEPAGGDSDEEDGYDYDDAESIELDSDLEEQLMKGNMKLGKSGKQGEKKKRKSDDEMEEVDEEESTRGKKKARK